MNSYKANTGQIGVESLTFKETFWLRLEISLIDSIFHIETIPFLAHENHNFSSLPYFALIYCQILDNQGWKFDFSVTSKLRLEICLISNVCI